MEESIESIKNRIKNKHNISFIKEKTNHQYLKSLISRLLISIILLLGSVIYINYSNDNLLLYKKYVFTDSLAFTKIADLYNKYFGESVLFKKAIDEKTVEVFNEQLKYNSASMFYDGAALEVGQSYLTPSLESGIVVFIGEKDNYGNTLIIQGVDGIDYWYGNITNSNITMYEYIEKGSLIGETLSNELYLVFVKDGEYLNYEEHI